MNELFNEMTTPGNQSMETLAECNALTGRYGLSLTGKQLQMLQIKQQESLAASGRVEFGDGVIRLLIEEFCDSPFISQENYEDIIAELLDAFYYFKTESEDRIPDDELIKYMRHHFDTTCQGSLEYLSGTTLEDLCRNTRYGYEVDDKDRYGRPF